MMRAHEANSDMSFFKNFPFFSEKTKLQFRREIYNLFNHTQFTGGGQQ
jgi:hypothetical protein